MLSIFLAAATLFGSALIWRQLSLSQTTTLGISAAGKVYYKPDVAEVSVSTVTKGIDPDAVQAENDEKMTAIIDYLKNSGIKEEDVKTTGYNLYPEYQQTDNGVNTLKIAGYTLSQTIFFKIREIASTPKIVGGLTDKGVNNISGVSFSLSDERFEELKSQAREKAVVKAKQDLEKTKSLYGFRKARLMNISDYPVYPSATYRDAKDLGMGGAEFSGISPIQTGTGELEVTVSLTYELR